MSILLKKGITGFYDSKNLCFNRTDYKEFRKICYSLQNTINLKITDTVNPDCSSYFYAEFTDGENRIYFLMNKYYPVAGFTEEIFHGDKIFIDIDSDISYMTEYEIIPAVTLNSVFKETENDLAVCELEQIKYWKPVSVGNIIFNEWD